jgi:ABC-type Na+ efflux pump permease subunit
MIASFIGFSVIITATYLKETYMGSGSFEALSILFMPCIFLLMLVYGTVMHVEKYEDKNKTYGLLRTLPIRAREIVFAKYLLPMLLGIAGIGFLYLTLKLFSFEVELNRLTPAVLIIAGNISLVASGFGYVGIYKWGFSKIRIAILVFYMALMVVPLALFILIRKTGGSAGFDGFISSLANANLFLISVCGLLLYFGSMFLAVRIKENEEL